MAWWLGSDVSGSCSKRHGAEEMTLPSPPLRALTQSLARSVRGRWISQLVCWRSVHEDTEEEEESRLHRSRIACSPCGRHLPTSKSLFSADRGPVAERVHLHWAGKASKCELQFRSWSCESSAPASVSGSSCVCVL